MSFNIAFQFSYMTMIIERGWEFTGIRQGCCKRKRLTDKSITEFICSKVSGRDKDGLKFNKKLCGLMEIYPLHLSSLDFDQVRTTRTTRVNV